MAVQLVTKINRYIGTAAEIAAMTLTGIPAGSTFFESDTGILKILNAAGALVTAPSETVSLSGSIVEYAWLDDAEAPTPTEAFAWGYNFNTTTGEITAYGWSGTAWVEVV